MSWGAGQRDPAFEKKARRTLSRLVVPRAPAAVLEGVYWLIAFHGCLPKGTGGQARLGRMLQRAFGLGDAVDDYRAVAAAFRRHRGELSHTELMRAHPHYRIWWEATRAAAVRRAGIWKDKGKVPGFDGEFELEHVAARFSVPGRTLKRWLLDVQAGRCDPRVPAILDKRRRRKEDAQTRAELASDIDAELDTRASHDQQAARHQPPKEGSGIEVYEAGVCVKAEDLELVPRKIQFDRPGGVRAFIDGGHLVVLDRLAPHDGQAAFFRSGARFRTAACGIRGGKTRAGAVEAVRHAVMMRGSHGWVVGPTYPMMEVALRAFFDDTALAERSDLLSSTGYLKRDRQVHFANGSLVEFRSAEWGDTLRGPGLNWIWKDEAQLIKEEAHRILMGRTSDQLGRIWDTGTPLGIGNHFHRTFAWGLDPEHPQYASFRWGSTANPMVTPAEVESMRAQVPDAWWRQEYLAQFIEGVASVFGDLTACIVDAPPPPSDRIKRPRHVLGLDIARKRDFMFGVVMNNWGQVVDTYRSNKTTWAFQLERVLELVDRWGGCPVVGDATGVGDAFVERLKAAGVRVTPIVFTAKSKIDLVEQLMLDFEGQRVWLPRSGAGGFEDRLIYELQIYRRQLTRRGNVSYNAPEGEHDDGVVALMNANWGVRRLRLAAGIAQASSAAAMMPGAPNAGPQAPQRVRAAMFERRGATVFGSIDKRRQTVQQAHEAERRRLLAELEAKGRLREEVS